MSAIVPTPTPSPEPEPSFDEKLAALHARATELHGELRSLTGALRELDRTADDRHEAWSARGAETSATIATEVLWGAVCQLNAHLKPLLARKKTGEWAEEVPHV